MKFFLFIIWLTVITSCCVRSHAGTISEKLMVDLGEFQNSPWRGVDRSTDNLTSLSSARSFVEAAAEPPREPVRAFFFISPYLKEGGEPGEVIFRLSRSVGVPVRFRIELKPKVDLVAPAMVVLPAGQKSVSFKFSAKDNDYTSLNRLGRITLLGPIAPIVGYTRILDDEQLPKLTLKLPSEFREGDGIKGVGTITLNRPLDEDGFVDLVQLPREQLNMAGQISIGAGETRIDFPVSALDDTKLDGDVNLEVFATAGPRKLAEQKVMVRDNETRQLICDIPATISEGVDAVGTIRIAGTLRTNLVVTLSSDKSGAVSLPSTVTIFAGETSTEFKIGKRENKLLDGTRRVTISARANNFPEANHLLVVFDDDVSSFRISGYEGIVDPQTAKMITVSAVDLEGNVVRGYSGRVNLSASFFNGDNLPMVPSSVALVAGSANFTTAVPATSSLVTGIHATDGSKITGKTVNFDNTRTLRVSASSLVWDEGRRQIYAIVPSAANTLQVIDPKTMAVTGGIALENSPHDMVLTSGGEYLYVSLKGNGTIAKIDPASMTVISTFSVRSDELAEATHAEKIVAVPGQPELVVATRMSHKPEQIESVIVVYDRGIAKNVTTPGGQSYHNLASSADSSIFFDFYAITSNGGYRSVRRLLKLDERGISEVEGSETSIDFFHLFDLRTSGNLVFNTEGKSMDGLKAIPTSKYSRGGAVYPDLAANRIFYIDNLARIIACDPFTGNKIETIQMPNPSSQPSHFTRCGSHELAFLTTAGITVVHSPRMVPAFPAADLVTSVESSSPSAPFGTPVTFTVKVTNQGPNIARNAILTTSISGYPILGLITTSNGSSEASKSGVKTSLGDLGVGMSVILNVTVTQRSPQSMDCSAQATSQSIDPNFTNSAGFSLVVDQSIKPPNDWFSREQDKKGEVMDPTAGTSWVSMRGDPSIYHPYEENTLKNPPPLARSVASINKLTKEVSQIISLPGDPAAESIELSRNERYLFVGLEDKGGIARIDLAANPRKAIRIPIPPDSSGFYPTIGALAALEGDGTSILVTTNGGNSVMVIDGEIPRPQKLTIPSTYSFNWRIKIAKSNDPTLFRFYDSEKSYWVRVSGEGVTLGVPIARPSSLALGGLDNAKATLGVQGTASEDADGDGILNCFEYLFATSPMRFDPNPIQLRATEVKGATQSHLIFPRRAGMTMSAYGYEISPDLVSWNPIEDVVETVLSTQDVEGLQVETIMADISMPTGRGFVRLRWLLQ